MGWYCPNFQDKKAGKKHTFLQKSELEAFIAAQNAPTNEEPMEWEKQLAAEAK